jgi:hypothetical protein
MHVQDQSILVYILLDVLVQYEYLWADGVKVKKPIKLTAPQYIDALFSWIETQVQLSSCPGVIVPCFMNFQIRRPKPCRQSSSSSMLVAIDGQVPPAKAPEGLDQRRPPGCICSPFNIFDACLLWFA